MTSYEALEAGGQEKGGRGREVRKAELSFERSREKGERGGVKRRRKMRLGRWKRRRIMTQDTTMTTRKRRLRSRPRYGKYSNKAPLLFF